MNPIVRQIVDRCHVADSFRKVLRYMISRMQGGAWKACSKKVKRALWKDMVKAHENNQKLYNFVTKGIEYARIHGK